MGTHTDEEETVRASRMAPRWEQTRPGVKNLEETNFLVFAALWRVRESKGNGGDPRLKQRQEVRRGEQAPKNSSGTALRGKGAGKEPQKTQIATPYETN